MTPATTASPRRPHAVLLHGVVGAAALVPGLLVAGLGWLLSGSAAAQAATFGALAVLGILLFGSTAVDLVAGLMPGASLGVALMTYALQLVLLVAVLLAASETERFQGLAERRWLFAGLLAVMLGWMVGQVVAAVRVRIPVYDLPDAAAATAPTTPVVHSSEAVRR
jgi:ATP synthase protein I